MPRRRALPAQDESKTSQQAQLSAMQDAMLKQAAAEREKFETLFLSMQNRFELTELHLKTEAANAVHQADVLRSEVHSEQCSRTELTQELWNLRGDRARQEEELRNAQEAAAAASAAAAAQQQVVKHAEDSCNAVSQASRESQEQAEHAKLLDRKSVCRERVYGSV